MPAPDARQKVEDGTFLAKEFDIAPRKAAKLVSSDAEESETVRDGVQQNLDGEDPLEGVPIPEGSDDFTADTDETRLKPVLHRPNKRAGGG
jgi:hypothetical protein